MILLRGRHLTVVMAALFRNRSMLLRTRPKGAQRLTAGGKEPGGIENRDHRHRYKTLAQLPSLQSSLLLCLDGSYSSEVAAVNAPPAFFLFCRSRTGAPQMKLPLQTGLSLPCVNR